MSRKIQKQITCPQCGSQVNTAIYTSVNVTTSPQLREKVMDESLFMWRCSNCSYEALLLHPCLYHDMDRGFMVYLIPELRDDFLSDKEVSEQFPELKALQKRLAPDLNALKEKILIFEARLDDRAVELCKLALQRVVSEKKGVAAGSGYFCMLDRDAGQIGFSFFLKNSEKSADIVGSLLKEKEQPSGFLRIDDAWASEALKEYQAK